MNLKNKIEFLPLSLDIFHNFPKPDTGQKQVPDWYKKQPSNYGELEKNNKTNLTVKKCQPFFDAMSFGYILKCPVDIYINTKKEKALVEIDSKFSSIKDKIIGWHYSEQVSHYPIDSNLYINDIFRIHPTWMIKTPAGYSTFFTSPIHQEPIPIKAVEAIVDTDNFLNSGLNSFFLQKNFEGVIKEGTPILQVIPFKREDWEMSVDLNFDTQLLIDQRKNMAEGYPNYYKTSKWTKKLFG